MFKKEKHFIVFLLILFFNQLFVSYAEVVDKIIVIVNDEIITQGDIDKILFPIYQQYKIEYRDEELAEKLEETRKNVLQRLIDDKLLLSEARRKNIEVDDKEVRERIDEVKRRFPSEEEFRKAMAEENIILSELQKRFRDRIMIDKLIDMEIRRKVSLTPSEVTSYYESKKDAFKDPRKVKVRSILIRINKGRSDEEAYKLATEILARLREGGDFALLAQEYSEGPYADSGGDMGWVKEGELMDRINELVFSLNAGEISDILKTNLGLHIFKVEETMPTKIKEFHEVKVKIEEILFTKKIEERLKEWLQELRKNAYIAFR